MSSSFLLLFIWAIPNGLGGGNNDAVLNNYVAYHFESRHMSWLHSFWGIGASIGPLIVAYFFTLGTYWQGPFWTVMLIQSLLFTIIFISRPIWLKFDHSQKKISEDHEEKTSLLKTFKTKKVKHAMGSFVAYVAMEGIVTVYLASYCVSIYDYAPEIAASMVSIFFFSLTFGRILDGFVSYKFSNLIRMRFGQALGLSGIIIFILSSNQFLITSSFVMMGIGFAPQFPIMMHETPNRFGQSLSSSVISLQITSSSIGFIMMNLFSGSVVNVFGLSFLPYFMAVMMITLILLNQNIHYYVQKKNASH